VVDASGRRRLEMRWQPIVATHTPALGNIEPQAA
jgi:hypothetical protein